MSLVKEQQRSLADKLALKFPEQQWLGRRMMELSFLARMAKVALARAYERCF
jgi:hypothetical protein